MKSGVLKQIDFKSQIGTSPKVIFTKNEDNLHIVGGNQNNVHIMYNLSTNVTKNIVTFNEKRWNHGLLYNKITNTMYMFGGHVYETKEHMNDFLTLNLNKKSNYKWMKNTKKSMLRKMGSFGYVLYDNRIIITFGLGIGSGKSNVIIQIYQGMIHGKGVKQNVQNHQHILLY